MFSSDQAPALEGLACGPGHGKEGGGLSSTQASGLGSQICSVGLCSLVRDASGISAQLC